MEKGIHDLIEVSRFYGNNPEYIIAGGGNTSYKNEEKLWIKASGSSLATIDEDGFVCLSRKALRKISEKSYSENSSEREAQVKQDLHQAILSPGNKRPSVETSLHEIIDFPFVVHTHPTLVNALMCSNKAKEITNQLFSENTLFVEYTDPGYILFKKVETEILQFRKKRGAEPSIIFLQNHGIFVGANTIDEIKATYNCIEKTLLDCIKRGLPSTKEIDGSNDEVKQAIKILSEDFGMNANSILFFNNQLIQSFISSPDAFNKVNKPFTPDDIVYCKSNYVFVAENDDLKKVVCEFENQCGYLPKVIVLQKKGVLTAEENLKSAKTVLEVFQNMMKVSFYSENFGGPHFMTQQQIDFIDNWEVENYRRQISKQS